MNGPMLAENFYETGSSKGSSSKGSSSKSFCYGFDSGQRKKNKWIFNKTPTFYKRDPTDWLMSEKIDGVRCFWDKKNGFVSRSNNPFQVPSWFLQKFQDYMQKFPYQLDVNYISRERLRHMSQECCIVKILTRIGIVLYFICLM